MKTSRILLPALAAVLLLATGCATQRIVSQWSNPDYASATKPFKKIMVVAATDQDAIRRNLEDRFVAELRTDGIDALPSYRFVAESGKDMETRLKAAVEKAGTDGVLVTRLLRIERHVDVSPGYYEPYFGYYPWYYSGWYDGFYSPPRVYRYPIYYSETTLYDAANNQTVWSGTIRTIDPENASKAIKQYVDTVVNALQDKHLLRG